MLDGKVEGAFDESSEENTKDLQSEKRMSEEAHVRVILFLVLASTISIY